MDYEPSEVIRTIYNNCNWMRIHLLLSHDYTNININNHVSRNWPHLLLIWLSQKCNSFWDSHAIHHSHLGSSFTIIPLTITFPNEKNTFSFREFRRTERKINNNLVILPIYPFLSINLHLALRSKFRKKVNFAWWSKTRFELNLNRFFFYKIPPKKLV